MSALQNQPQIQHLRQLLQQNPALIQPVLQQIAETNPQLAALFAADPDRIAQAIGLDPEALGEDELPEGAHVIHVTEEEQAAIQRVRDFCRIIRASVADRAGQLQDLGFSRQAAIEAYFACDKNEEMAANYLFESGNQFD